MHPIVRKEYKAAEAFEKLKGEAESMNIHSASITRVDLWDGEEDLDKDDDNNDDDNDDNGDGQPHESEIPEPPPRVVDLYKEATTAIHELAVDPDDKDSERRLREINTRIQHGNLAENNNMKDVPEIPLDQWTIPESFFLPYYREVLKQYEELENNSGSHNARKAISVEQKLIDEQIRRCHFPEDWSVLVADDYLAKKASQSSQSDAPKQPSDYDLGIKYPWATGTAKQIGAEKTMKIIGS